MVCKGVAIVVVNKAVNHFLRGFLWCIRRTSLEIKPGADRKKKQFIAFKYQLKRDNHGEI